MSVPFVPAVIPPLPPGWTEHISMCSAFSIVLLSNMHAGPTGQPYYFNAVTQESTYIRPLPAFPIVPGQVPFVPPVQAVQPKQKKEKPLVKTPIPGTDWIRVKTTEGNTFYSHKVEKRSVWTVPDEIKGAVAQLEKEEEKRKHEEDEAARKAKEAKAKEVERVKAEVKDAVGKRKAAEPVPVDEVVISKKARVDEEEDDQGEDDGDDDEDDEDEEDSDMEDWQREAAAQLAAEAEAEKKRLEEEQKRQEEEAKAEAEALKNKQLNMPARVDLSIEEAKALFKVCTLAVITWDPSNVFLRPSCARRMSTRYIHGTCLCHCSSPTHVTYSCRQFLRVKRRLMNTAATAHASSGRAR